MSLMVLLAVVVCGLWLMILDRNAILVDLDPESKKKFEEFEATMVVA